MLRHKCRATEKIHEALRHCRRSSTTASPLREMLLFRTLRRAQATLSDREITLALVTTALDQFAAHQPDAAEILRLRFFEDVQADVVMARQTISSSEFHRLQRAAIEGLADLLNSQEAAGRRAFARPFLDRLSAPPYDLLFGFDRHLETLNGLLNWRRDRNRARNGARNPVIGIYGIGGQGKHAAALDALDEALRRLEANREDVGYPARKRISWNIAPRFR